MQEMLHVNRGEWHNKCEGGPCPWGLGISVRLRVIPGLRQQCTQGCEMRTGHSVPWSTANCPINVFFPYLSHVYSTIALISATFCHVKFVFCKLIMGIVQRPDIPYCWESFCKYVRCTQNLHVQKKKDHMSNTEDDVSIKGTLCGSPQSDGFLRSYSSIRGFIPEVWKTLCTLLSQISGDLQFGFQSFWGRMLLYRKCCETVTVSYFAGWRNVSSWARVPFRANMLRPALILEPSMVQMWPLINRSVVTGQRYSITAGVTRVCLHVVTGILELWLFKTMGDRSFGKES